MTEQSINAYIYIYIYELGVMGKLLPKLYKLKITLTSQFLRYIYQNYMKMSLNIIG